MLYSFLFWIAVRVTRIIKKELWIVHQGIAEKPDALKRYAEAFVAGRTLEGERSGHCASLAIRGSFSAVSTPILASKYAFFSVFRDIQVASARKKENHLLASKFCKFLLFFAESCKIRLREDDVLVDLEKC